MSSLKLAKSSGVRGGAHQFGIKTQTKRDFPSWHFSMLNDQQRNRVIEQAIADLRLAGKTVVEIGTGTGLIALLFARCGAKRVITCEMNRNMSTIARQIIGATPFNSRITVIDKSSTQAIAEGLIEAGPDYIFTETVDCGVVGESFFQISCDIKQLAGPHTKVIPSMIRQVGVVIESQDMADLNRVQDVCGFDLSALNAFSTRTYFPVREQAHDYKVLTTPTVLRCYDYLSERPAIPCIVDVKQDGRAAGVMTWMEIQFGDHVFSNQPGTTSHWHKAFHPFEPSMALRCGQRLALKIEDDGSVAPQLGNSLPFEYSDVRAAQA